ncbi:MAG: GtrA family protein [Desulfovibrionales bacterium]
MVSSRFLRFSFVGCVGYVVDVLVLYLVLSVFGPVLLMGRAVSYVAAATTTWYVNRRITFPDSVRTKPVRQWLTFLLCNSFGGLVNYLLYSVLVITLDLMAEMPFVAVGFGSLAGLILNYSLSKFLVFQKSSSSVEIQ